MGEAEKQDIDGPVEKTDDASKSSAPNPTEKGTRQGEMLERKPISVNKLGKMKKRDPSTRPLAKSDMPENGHINKKRSIDSLEAPSIDKMPSSSDEPDTERINKKRSIESLEAPSIDKRPSNSDEPDADRIGKKRSIDSLEAPSVDKIRSAPADIDPKTDHSDTASRDRSAQVQSTEALSRRAEQSIEEPPAKRYKRPGARRDPAEAEAERQETIRRQEERDRLAKEAATIRNQYHRGSEVVRSHYNARPNQGRAQRNQSPIVNLRNFNNWVKSTLIRNFTTERGLHVLDMGCGKGGDLMKWDKADIERYVGIDLAEVSIDQARGRYRNMRNPRFSAEFYAFDCFGQPLKELLAPNRSRFDIVSMQFCMHYAFESEAKARQMLSNVACSLPRGGKFLGTIPSSDAIIKHIEQLPEGKKEWGNDIYRVEFENQPPAPPDVVFRPIYGHRYTFYLKDAVDIVPEYVVPFNAFRALAEEYNLELLYHKGFHEVFEEFCDTFDGGMLLDRMGVVKKDGTRGIEGDEREACGFYSAFCFEKRGAK